MCFDNNCSRISSMLLEGCVVGSHNQVISRILTIIVLHEDRKCVRKQMFKYWYLKSYHLPIICQSLVFDCSTIQRIQALCVDKIIHKVESALNALKEKHIIEEKLCVHGEVILSTVKNEE